MSAASFLRTARTSRGMSQRALAQRANVRQPGIADIESGAHDTTLSRLEELLAALQYRLTPIPTTSRGVWEVAYAVAAAVLASDEANAWRQVIQLADDLAREPAATRIALTVTPPPSTGSARYDALIAGLTEYRLRGLPCPAWVNDSRYSLADEWDVETLPSLREAARNATPEEFSRHGIYLDPRELESV